MVLELATDPYVTSIGTLPAHADEGQAREWIERNRGRWTEGRGFSFAIEESATGRAVGQLGLWLAELEQGRAELGYVVMPGARGRGYAAAALGAATGFAWTIPALHPSSCTSSPGPPPRSGPPSGPATAARACCAATRRSAACVATCSCTPRSAPPDRSTALCVALAALALVHRGHPRDRDGVPLRDEVGRQ